MRLERLAPPVPKQQFAEYVSRFARGAPRFAGRRIFRAGSNTEFEISNLKSESCRA